MSRYPIGSPDAMNAQPPTSPPDEEDEEEEDTPKYERDYEPDPPDRDEASEWGGIDAP